MTGLHSPGVDVLDRSIRTALRAVVAGSTLLCVALASAETPDVIADGSTVAIELTLRADDGTVLQTTVGKEPLIYHPGRDELLPELEKALVGLKKNDSRTIALGAEQGFGPVDPNAFETVPRDVVPEESRVAGTALMASDGNMVRVHEVRENEIVLDFNHPLAGQMLHFDIKVLSID